MFIHPVLLSVTHPVPSFRLLHIQRVSGFLCAFDSSHACFSCPIRVQRSGPPQPTIKSPLSSSRSTQDQQWSRAKETLHFPTQSLVNSVPCLVWMRAGGRRADCVLHANCKQPVCVVFLACFKNVFGSPQAWLLFPSALALGCRTRCYGMQLELKNPLLLYVLYN